MLTLRECATPLTIGSFFISAITGIVIFFHFRIGLVRPAHEWLSWFLVLGGLLHIITNWKSFISYCSKKISASIFAIFLILCLLSFMPLGNKQERPLHRASKALIASSLETVAQIIKEKPDNLMERLIKKGLKIESTEQTIIEIAAQSEKSGKSILGLIF